MHTELNVVYAVFFTNSNVNAVATLMFETTKTLLKTEDYFQYVAQKVMNDNNSDSFTAHYASHFIQKPSPQQCRKIMSLDIISTINPIGSMKTWGNSLCTLCMKETIEIIDNSRHWLG